MEIEKISPIPDFTIIIDDVDNNDPNKNTNDNSLTEEVEELEEDVIKSEETELSDNADPKAIAFYDELKSRGYFTEEFDGTWESLDQLFDTLPNKVLSSLIEQAPDLTKQVVRFAFSSQNITKEDLTNFMKTYLEEVDLLEQSIETMDDARSYLEKVYEEKGVPKKTIKLTLDTLEEDDELLDTAKELFEKQKEEAKFKKSEELIAKKEQDEINTKQQQEQFVSKVVEELDNIGWKPTRVKEVKNVLNNNFSSLLNETLKSPKAIIKLADFLTYYKNGDINYDSFINQVETPSTKSLKNKIETALSSPGVNTKGSITKNDNSRFDEIPIV